MLDKEFIELLKTVAGNTEFLVIWYFITLLVKTFIEGVMWVVGFYMLGYAVSKAVKIINEGS